MESPAPANVIGPSFRGESAHQQLNRLFGSYRHPDGSRAIELGTDSAQFDREVALHPFRMMVVLQFEAMRDAGRVAGRGLRRISKTR